MKVAHTFGVENVRVNALAFGFNVTFEEVGQPVHNVAGVDPWVVVG